MRFLLLVGLKLIILTNLFPGERLILLFNLMHKHSDPANALESRRGSSAFASRLAAKANFKKIKKKLIIFLSSLLRDSL